jgi:2-oxoglutarate ferredoxin oxidoreductase subunit gamma
MIEKSYFAGFGGQGVISMGQIWVYCAMQEGKNVTCFPFYGAEKRGGIARTSVIVSSDEIASPLVTTADSVIVMNGDSLPICEGLLKKDGLMLVNSSLVKDELEGKSFKVVKIDAQALAEEAGNPKGANMVMLGALAKLTGALKLDHIEEILTKFFKAKPALIAINVKAIQAGYKAV